MEDNHKDIIIELENSQCPQASTESDQNTTDSNFESVAELE